MKSQNHRILIVDDERELAEFLQLMLVRQGFAVSIAVNGLEAKDILGKEKIDLVLSDYNMPKMNGKELFDWIHKEGKSHFVLMSGFSDISSTSEAHEMGMDGFLKKPFTAQDLIEMISGVLGPGESMEDLEKNLIPVPMILFLSGYELPYKLYDKTTASHWLPLCQAGEVLSQRSIEEVMQAGKTELYVRKEELSSFIHFHLSLIRSQWSEKAQGGDQVLDSIHCLSQICIQSLFGERREAHLTVTQRSLETYCKSISDTKPAIHNFAHKNLCFLLYCNITSPLKKDLFGYILLSVCFEYESWKSISANSIREQSKWLVENFNATLSKMKWLKASKEESAQTLEFEMGWWWELWNLSKSLRSSIMLNESVDPQIFLEKRTWLSPEEVLQVKVLVEGNDKLKVSA